MPKSLSNLKPKYASVERYNVLINSLLWNFKKLKCFCFQLLLPIMGYFPFLSFPGNRIWLVLLLCKATQSAVMPQYVMCLSVCPSVCDVQVLWSHRLEYLKIISRLISFRFMLGLTPTWAIWCNGNTPKVRVEKGWSAKTCNISKMMQDRTKVIMTD